ncbi:tRNA glutamyl-Q(34) synthetase GluQRS [Veillonella intestinalis]|uniref:tRNA glutamyl-Q(34) synthetase GluQRS n=1 Tax=Veillonella intestinalis TaxID=2941341 RepID=UPI00203D0CFC|nr:tRNA glutamyl-Q(34) synthetase GluQRS [Veillonella intestinalis]
MKGRFAPSPTGHIHLGNVWIAMLSWLVVKQQGGTFVLRMEDIDTQRAKRTLGDDLLDDLEWLGLTWDEGPRTGGPAISYWQSERYDFYEAQLQKWQTEGLIYPCFCNRARLQSISSAPHGHEGIAHYDGHCRHLNETMRHQLYSQKEPSWRLKVAKRRYEFMDSWQGLQSQELWPGTDDFVVKRADGMFAYNLAVVMDDIAMGITDVVRGYDLLPAVASQLWLYEVLDESAPIYWHAPLVVDEDGYRLSKRQQSITLRELRESGYSAPMILGRLALAAGLVSRKALGPGETLSWSALLDSNIENLSLKQQQIKLTNFDIVI